MTRDRLQELKNLMAKGERDEDADNSGVEKSAALLAFCEHVKATKHEVAELKFKVRNLKTFLNDSQQWKNYETRKELERKIEEEKLVIGTTAKRIRNNLKAMKNSPGPLKQSPVIVRIKEVQINAILNDLNEILKDYLNCLVQQREKSLKIFTDMIEVKGDSMSDIDTLLEEGKIAIFTNNLLMNDMEERLKLREAEDRRENILKIESSILEVRNLFNELALIVDLQQEKVEEVEKLVDDNLARIESGKKKLFSASKKKEKIRYRKLMVAFICTGVILIVVILLTIL